jgi:hypothetical protein
MMARIRRGMQAAVRELETWVVHRLELAGVIAPARPRAERPRPAPPPTDERTAHRMAEKERGGMSSTESDARWACGENPGGIHHKAVRHEGPEHQRPEQEEPQAREERAPRGEKHLPSIRRGS